MSRDRNREFSGAAVSFRRSRFLFVGFIRLKGINEISDENHQKDNAFYTADLISRSPSEESIFETDKHQQDGDGQIQRNILDAVDAGNFHRPDKGRDAQDQQNIEYIGSHYVSDGDVCISLDGAEETHHQFRHGGADAHDGQADHEFAQAGPTGDVGRAVHQIIGPENHQGQSGKQDEDLD